MRLIEESKETKVNTSAIPNVNWLKIQKITETTCNSIKNDLVITSFSAVFASTVKEGWRNLRFYRGDAFNLIGTRRRRGGGILFMLKLANPSGFTDSRLKILTDKGFRHIEASYEDMCRHFTGFDELITAYMGMSYTDLVKQNIDNSITPVARRTKTVKTSAPVVDRSESDAQWGSW